MDVRVVTDGDGPEDFVVNVDVVLSERNLKTLSGLWEMAKRGEAVPSIHRHTQNGFLTVRVEPDEVHYDRPEGGPGQDPIFDRALAEVSG